MCMLYWFGGGVLVCCMPQHSSLNDNKLVIQHLRLETVLKLNHLQPKYLR